MSGMRESTIRRYRWIAAEASRLREEALAKGRRLTSAEVCNLLGGLPVKELNRARKFVREQPVDEVQPGAAPESARRDLEMIDEEIEILRGALAKAYAKGNLGHVGALAKVLTKHREERRLTERDTVSLAEQAKANRALGRLL